MKLVFNSTALDDLTVQFEQEGGDVSITLTGVGSANPPFVIATPGSGLFVWPANWATARVDAWGPGDAGGHGRAGVGGDGGGAGEYATKIVSRPGGGTTAYSVGAGNSLTATTWDTTVVVANAGSGTTGGTGGTGDVTVAGGNGASHSGSVGGAGGAAHLGGAGGAPGSGADPGLPGGLPGGGGGGSGGANGTQAAGGDGRLRITRLE